MVGRFVKRDMNSAAIGAARLIVVLLCALVCAAPTSAIGQERYVEFSATPNSLRLVSSHAAAPILVDSQDYPGVLRAARDFQADIRRVTKIQPTVIADEQLKADDVLIVGTLGKNRRIEDLIRAGKLDVTAIRGRWESFLIQLVSQPWPGVKRAPGHRRQRQTRGDLWRLRCL